MTGLRKTLSVIVMVLITAMGSLPGSAAETDQARVTIQAAVNEGLGTFTDRSYSLEDRTRLLDGLLRRYSDPTLLSANILGRYWGKISPTEQREFSETFMHYLVSSFVGLLKNLESGVTVRVGDAFEVGSRIRVTSVVTFPSEPGVAIPVDWELATAPDGRQVVVDVTAEGISIIRAMREDFASVLRSSGGKIEPLMDALSRKIAENNKTNMAGRSGTSPLP